MRRKAATALVLSALLICTALLCLFGFRQSQKAQNSAVDTIAPSQLTATPIQHVIVIMQENRSFDEYFGTYPGAGGIPGGVCIPDGDGGCVAPYHNPDDSNVGGRHHYTDAIEDIDGGKMDGFVIDAGQPDVMGYHDAREIPNYWSYARNYVLQDHMFESIEGYSALAHTYMVSNWAANCSRPDDPASCRNSLDELSPFHAWTDMTYLLHKNSVSWAYYVTSGLAPDTDDDGMGMPTSTQSAGTPNIWNPLPTFTTVKQDGELGNVQDVSRFYTAAAKGTLPNVCWVVPDQEHSEHPPSSIATGQAYVTKVINAIMSGPDWNSCAIFLAWDDWGGFYDHVVPTAVDGNGYGLRVPGLVISPYAKTGYIDHEVLSFDAYNKFIEDNFLTKQRLDPSTDGRWDPRPDVRENERQLGDLMNDFNFSKSPSAPLILSLHPSPGPPSSPPPGSSDVPPSRFLGAHAATRAKTAHSDDDD